MAGNHLPKSPIVISYFFRIRFVRKLWKKNIWNLAREMSVWRILNRSQHIFFNFITFDVKTQNHAIAWTKALLGWYSIQIPIRKSNRLFSLTIFFCEIEIVTKFHLDNRIGILKHLAILLWDSAICFDLWIRIPDLFSRSILGPFFAHFDQNR